MAFSKDVTIIINQHPDDASVISGLDLLANQRAIETMRAWLTSVDPGHLVIDLKVHDLNADLDARLADKLSAESQIGVIVFLGHGNSKAFALNKANRYSAQELADVVLRIIQSRGISKNLTIYMNSCELACPKLNGKRFSDVMTGAVASQLATRRGPKLDSLVIAAHFSMTPSGWAMKFRRTERVAHFILTRFGQGTLELISQLTDRKLRLTLLVLGGAFGAEFLTSNVFGAGLLSNAAYVFGLALGWLAHMTIPNIGESITRNIQLTLDGSPEAKVSYERPDVIIVDRLRACNSLGINIDINGL